jgi:phage gpG-like protein
MFTMGVTMIPSSAVLMAQFEDFGVGIRSLIEPLKESVRNVVIPSIRENFDAEGRPSWEPLSESREAQKAVQGLPPDILTASGALRRIATQLNIWEFDGGYGSGEAVASITGFGDADYGELHMSGTERMPAREFAVLQEEDEDGILEVFDNYIAMRQARAGF